ncbi:hypothetical protein [Acinetobacter baumannii]|uniref:hypothetical protein n=1 Tax=Acinetobacter baumannii TaxID=470 RepID=UPI00148ED881|nr:hypothetical protein [Acinetobacter baumannii]
MVWAGGGTQDGKRDAGTNEWDAGVVWVWQKTGLVELAGEVLSYLIVSYRKKSKASLSEKR